jgi:uncharacterized membrane protein YhfC
MISSLAFSFIINSGQTSLLSESVIEAVRNPLTSTAPYMFLLSGFERIFAICMQISLSILVFYSVACKNKWWLYPFAILLHALTDCPAVLMQTGVLKNVFIVEGLVMVSALLLAYIAYITDKRLSK